MDSVTNQLGSSSPRSQQEQPLEQLQQHPQQPLHEQTPSVTVDKIQYPSFSERALPSASSSSSIVYPSLSSKDFTHNSTDPSAEFRSPVETDAKAHLLYPDVFAEEIAQADLAPVEASQEVLVTIPGAIVHLIDKEASLHLASGDFSLVRLSQRGNGIAVFARVGSELQWPVTKDEASVKLDQFHYFFSLHVPPEIDEECRSSPEERSHPREASPKGPSENILNYGVTFATSCAAASLQELDEVLKQYTYFTAPAVVQAEEATDPQIGVRDGQIDINSQVPSAQTPTVESEKDFQPGRPLDSEGSQTQTKDVQEIIASDAKGSPREQGSAEYWTLLAPNVEDYSSSIARAIAVGTSNIIKGLFWCSEATIAQLEKGNDFVKGRLKANETSTKMSPSTMRRIRRAREISVRSEQVATSLLSGVVKAAAFVTRPLVTSKAGKKLLSLLPGEIAIASLDSFGKLFDAVEVAGRNVLTTSSVVTTGLVSQRYGNEAGEFTQEGLETAGHFLTTAWSVSKTLRVFYPTGLAKSAAKVAGDELKSQHVADKDDDLFLVR